MALPRKHVLQCFPRTLDEERVAQAVARGHAAVHGQRFGMLAPSVWADEGINGLVAAVRQGRLEASPGERARRPVEVH